MSGGETKEASRKDPVQDDHFDDSGDLMEAMSEGGDDLDEEVARAQSNDGAVPESVMEKSGEGRR